MGWGVFPRVWVSPPSPIPCLSWMYNLKGFCKLGNPSVRAKTSFSFRVSNAAWQPLVHSNGSESSPFKKLYSGFTLRPRLGIQIQQNPVVLRIQEAVSSLGGFLLYWWLVSISHQAPGALVQLESQICHCPFANLDIFWCLWVSISVLSVGLIDPF